MIKRYVIFFYTAEPKEPEFYWNNSEDMSRLFNRIVELTKHRAKFAIHEIGECAGDFS